MQKIFAQANYRSTLSLSSRYVPGSQQLTSIAQGSVETELSYEHGNLHQKGDWTFEHDSQNRLTRVQKAGDRVAEYRYAPSGYRIQKQVGSESTHYLYDLAGNLVVKGDREFVYLGSSPIAAIDNNKTYYIHTGHLNQPLVVTDQTRAKVWEATYSPFGEIDVTTNTLNVDLRFAGQIEDAETGLYYNVHRYYDPSLGRYIQSDPIGLDGGINTYGYVSGNPVNFVDSLGLFRFATRPLGETNRFGFGVGNTNVGVQHEHGFYSTGDNVGFFKTGIGPDNPSNLSRYTMFGPYYDDNTMFLAELLLRKSGNWTPENPKESMFNPDSNDYELLTHNCQDFADALRQKYENLEGKTCVTPFMEGVCRQ